MNIQVMTEVFANTYESIARFMSKVIMVPVSTWNMYSMLMDQHFPSTLKDSGLKLQCWVFCVTSLRPFYHSFLSKSIIALDSFFNWLGCETAYLHYNHDHHNSNFSYRWERSVVANSPLRWHIQEFPKPFSKSANTYETFLREIS